MCCTENCSTPSYDYNIAHFELNVGEFGIEVQNIPISLTFQIIAGEPDQPMVVLADIVNDPDEAVDKAERDVIQVIFDNEDSSSDLSDMLQDMKDMPVGPIGRSVRIEQGEVGSQEDDWAKTSIDDTGMTATITFDRQKILKTAKDWDMPYEKILAEIVIHEMIHAWTGDGSGKWNHAGQPGIGGTQYFYTSTSNGGYGVMQRAIYKDIFGSEPPGWRKVMGGATNVNNPLLDAVRSNSEHIHFFDGLDATYGAIVQNPTYDILWLGHERLN